jgi:hypothetical protein
VSGRVCSTSADAVEVQPRYQNLLIPLLLVFLVLTMGSGSGSGGLNFGFLEGLFNDNGIILLVLIFLLFFEF